ncbi:hypothetical protein BOFL111202_17205 [Bordetella flabilis]
MQPEWREFDDGEEWFAGRVLWVWAPTWEKPRLAIADSGDDFEWFYQGGAKLEDARSEYPTHCCDPEPPAPPTV